jgi:hypothetical protein
VFPIRQSIYLLAGKEWGCRHPFVRRTSGIQSNLLQNTLTSLGRPSPSLGMNFRWCLYGYLLSILETIIQRIEELYIKITLQVCYKSSLRVYASNKE